MKTAPAIGMLLCTLCSPLPSRAQEAGNRFPYGTEAPIFSVSTKKDSIGNVPVGGTKTDSVTVTNSGSPALTISNVRSSNPQFTVGPASASIAPGASRKFGITFVPTAASAQTSFIVFTHNGSTSPDTVTAYGTGTVPAFSVNRKTIPYGLVVIATGKPDSVSVTNTGLAPLVISGVTSTNARYTVAPANGTIQPGAKSTFRITFTPAAAGLQTGNIVFAHNAPTVRDTVSVTGTGTGFSVNRRSVAFGNVPVGSNSRDSVIVTNAAGTTLTISNAASSNGTFSVSPASASIPASGTAKFTITFTPASGTPQTGNVVFTHNAPGSPDTVTVSGTGTLSGFSLNRKTVPFGFVPLGSNRLDSVTVTDTGKAALVISSVTSGNGTFTVNPANATVQPAQSKTFYITFTPGNTTPQSGNLVFNHNAPGLHDTVALSGTGAVANFSVNRRTVPFGVVALGSNTLDSVTVTDTGKAALVISSVTSGNGTFTVSPASATVQPAQSRTFYITFTPVNTAPQSGNLVFNHNAPGLHDTVSLSGTGGAAAFSVNRRAVPFGIVAVGSNKLDSVTVADTGAAALVITSVTSSNGTFAVNPANATIQPLQSRKFYFTFTPTNTAPQTATVVFNHNAPGARDTLTLSGTGGAPAFSVSRRTVPFGSVGVGNSALDSVAVADSGAAPLVIASVTSSNGRFTVNPQSATIQPSGSRMFYITFAPQNANPQNGNVVFNHNAPGLRDTVTVSGTGLASLSAPVLLAPANGSAGLPLPVTLSWNGVVGATGYWLQMATDSAFTMIVISDSTLAATGRLVSGLPLNTRAYWRVCTKNTAGFGPFGAPWTFTTVSVGPVAATVSFSGDVTSTAYKMFGLPGVSTRKVSDLLSGTQKVDWRLLRDNGKDTAYPAYYIDLTSDSFLKTGEGYWLLQKTNLVIARTDTLPPLSPDGTFSITLQKGWNMITNPFVVTVLRSAVFAANGLPPTTVFWEHIGGTTTSSGTTFEPFKGYYFDNGAVNLPELKIPYPLGTAVTNLAKTNAFDWRAELVFDTDINTDRDNYIGIAPSVTSGRNELDQHEPPLVFDQGFLYFVRPEWDAAHTRFATDIRTSLGSGQTWDFEVWNPRRGPGRITLLGLEAIPPQNQAVLVNMANTSPVDMRGSNVYAYQSTSTKMQFKLIIGTKEYVDGEKAKLTPQAYELAQNFPNPFNPSTTISYTVPAGTDVRLEILSVIGQRVRVLDEGYRTAAAYSVVWDGKDENKQTVSSGVYFCRLVAGGNLIRTRKLVLLR